jgi:PAS domain S-box-containing protein
LNEGTRVVIEDVSLDPEHGPHRHIVATAGFRAVQSTPLIERSSGCLIGVLSTHFRDPGRPGDRELRWTDLYALQAGDIIALRISEQRLRESEARLRTAVNLVGLSLYTWYPLTGAVRWGANIKAMWGLPPDADVDHALFLAGIRPDDPPRVNAAIARAIDPAGDGLYNGEYRVNGIGDGVERWVLARGRTFFDNGQPVRDLGAVLDITEQKRAEERACTDRKRAEVAWRKTEESFRKFADTRRTSCGPSISGPCGTCSSARPSSGSGVCRSAVYGTQGIGSTAFTKLTGSASSARSSASNRARTSGWNTVSFGRMVAFAGSAILCSRSVTTTGRWGASAAVRKTLPVTAARSSTC